MDSGLLPCGGGASPAVLDAIATVDEAGEAWAIALLNRHPSEAVSCAISIGDEPLCGCADAVVLSGDGPDAFNDAGKPDRVRPTEGQLRFEDGQALLPPHSLTIVEALAPFLSVRGG